MGDMWISLEKGVKGFMSAGGATMVLQLLSSMPPTQVLWGSLTVGALVGIWTGITNAYKHWGDPVAPAPAPAQ